MNKYEAMIIFAESVKETALDESIGRVKAEIKKLGGEVDSATRLGKRAFARRMGKMDSGLYALIAFRMAADQIRALNARLKLDEEVFRTQIVRAQPKPPAPPQEKTPEGESRDLA